ncbi:hypothetical protein L596_010274 [Steinernema carpocapsae]|uniref:Uncharacterized protein n=1 Tax=Steinernema carpocapsae TaxID=34508 RepID=A0A4V6A6U5_STECR|nr:hypothetical protein L596_010274 [Steinernema carpocapsae]
MPTSSISRNSCTLQTRSSALYPPFFADSYCMQPCVTECSQSHRQISSPISFDSTLPMSARFFSCIMSSDTSSIFDNISPPNGWRDDQLVGAADRLREGRLVVFRTSFWEERMG